MWLTWTCYSQPVNSVTRFPMSTTNPPQPHLPDPFLLLPFCRTDIHKHSQVERGTFSPLAFSSSGGMGPLATVVYKQIATLISEKKGHPYSHVLHCLRCHLCFSLLCSAVMCLRGSRSTYHRRNII